jgi:D(-)-tartrate dehydratase
MRIVEMRDCTVPLAGGVANAVVSFADHTVSLVALVSDQVREGKPVIGFGFNSIGRYSQSGILRERMFPRLSQADPAFLLSEDDGYFSPETISTVAMKNEKPGGHGDRAGALGALELAVWDLNAKLYEEPAYQNIARYFGRTIERRAMSVYAAGGYYYSGASTHRLREELKGYQGLGFDAFKIKIGGASLKEDLERIEAALEIAGEGSHLSVDANGHFEKAEMLNYGQEIAPFGLRWYEEPGDPLDYALNSTLTEVYDGPIATGENLFSVSDTNNLIRFGGMRRGKDIFQMDAGLSYGLTEYHKMITLLEDNGFDRNNCFPHGGHLINLHIALGLNLGGCEAYPGVFQPFGGYPSECEIRDGMVQPTDAPGFGLEQKAELRPYLDLLR